MQEKLEKNEGSFSLFRSMYIWNTYYTIQFEMMIWLANLIFFLIFFLINFVKLSM